MPQIDLTQPGQAPLPTRRPLPIGKPVLIHKPSPAEQEVLEQIGWQPGQAVPENLAQLVEQLQQEAQASLAPDALPPPVPLDTPALQIPAEQDLESLPPEKQAEIRGVLSGILAESQQQYVAQKQQQEEMAGLAPELQEAMRAADQDDVLVENDLPTTPPAAAASTAPPAISAPTNCQNCGWELRQDKVAEVLEEDKLQFLQSLLGLQPFFKQYTLFGGRLQMIFRTLEPTEIELCLREAQQLAAERAGNDLSLRSVIQIDLFQQLRAGLQLVSLDGEQDLRVRLPRKWSDWQQQQVHSAHAVWQRVTTTLGAESLARLLLNTVGDFNNLVRRMEENAQNPDFWSAVAWPA